MKTAWRLLAGIFVLVAFVLPASAATSSPPSGCGVVAGTQTTAEAVSLRADLPDGGSPRAGQPFTLSWDASRLDCDGPAYLMIAMPEHVRFSGEGFIALAPNEPAPFRIGFHQDRMRLAIPLHIPRARHASADVTPYLTGRFDIEWAVVTPGMAAGNVEAQNLPLTIASGVPKIVVQDVYASETPAATTRSENGMFVLEDFKGHFRVTDAMTGALVLAAEGYRPTFSPTSRFLHWFGDLGSQLRVADLYAEKQIVDLDPEGAGGRGFYVQGIEWSPGDTFMLLAYEGEGALALQQMLTGRSIRYRADGCGACSPADGSVIQLDLDNSAVKLGVQSYSTYLYSLVFDEVLYAEGSSTDPVRADDLDAHVQTSSPTDMPQSGGDATWRLNGPRTASIDLREGVPIFLGGSRAVANEDDGMAPDDEVVARADAGEPLQDRGATGLVAKELLNRRTRIARRLAALGIDYRYSAPLAFDRVTFEYAKDDADYEEDDFRVKTGETALQRRLASPRTAQNVDAAVASLTSDHEACATVNRPYQGKAQVWSWRYKGVLRQVVQYYCYVSTGGIPEGIAFLVTGDDFGASYRLIGQTLNDETSRWGSYAFDEPDPEAEQPAEISDISFYDELRVFRPDESHVALLNARGGLALIDLDSGRRVLESTSIPSPANVEEIATTVDGRNLVQINDDGRFYVHSIASGEQVLAGRFVDDEVVVYDDAFRFEFDAGGRQARPPEVSRRPQALRACPVRRHAALAGHGDAQPGRPDRPSGGAGSGCAAASACRGGNAANVGQHRARGDGERRGPTRTAGALSRRPADRDSPVVGGRDGTRGRNPAAAGNAVGRGAGDGCARADKPAGHGAGRGEGARRGARQAVRSGDRHRRLRRSGDFAAELRADGRARLRRHPGGKCQRLLPLRLQRTRRRCAKPRRGAPCAARETEEPHDRRRHAVRADRRSRHAGRRHALFGRLLDAARRRRGNGNLDGCRGTCAGRHARPHLRVLGRLPFRCRGRRHQRRGGAVAAQVQREADRRAVGVQGTAGQPRGRALFRRRVHQRAQRDHRRRSEYDANANGVLDFDELYRELKRRVVTETGGRQTPWIARSGLVGDVPVL